MIFINIKEIAKLAGVSISTVSKVINQKDDSISEKTREKILEIVKEYNYIPYSSVNFSKKNWSIGVVLNLDNYNNSIIDGIISFAQDKGYTIVICNSYNSLEQELKNILSLCKNNVDGIIWEPLNKESIDASIHIEKKEIPYTTINFDFNDCYMNIPYGDYSYNLTQHLINRNHKNIACIVDDNHIKNRFLNGYKKCLFDNKIIFEEDLIFNNFDDNLLYNVNSFNVTGFISSNYKKALEFYNFMSFFNYNIPFNFSLVSLKNENDYSFKFPNISSFIIPNVEFGKCVCENIINKIEKSNKHSNVPYFNFKLNNYNTLSKPFNLNSKKIIVVGSINIDTYLNVSQFPNTGKTITSSTSSIYPGGKGMNQSIGVAKLGHRVSLIGNVGYDLTSNIIYRALDEYNVDTTGVKRCSDCDTGKAYIFVDNNGDSMISILNGANDMLLPNQIEERKELFSDSEYLLIQSEIPLETISKACDIAHFYGAKTIFKPSACKFMTNDLLSKIDIIVPNEEELFELCYKYSDCMEKQAEYILSCGVNTVIVTLKERGCYVKTKSWSKYFEALDVSAIDKTGASDAFISALSSYLLYGYNLEKAIRIAIYASSFCISREGVVPALIDKNSLENYIHQREPSILEI